MLKSEAQKEVSAVPNTDRIKARMDELNITQAQLAQKIGIATPTICQKINNIRPFSLDEAERVANVLDIPDKDFGRYFFDR